MISASKISFILLCLLHLGADGINPLLATTNECSHTFRARSRTFSSPSYNSYSRINETCNWRISASPDEKIVLSITNIDIEKSADCRFGEISVWDGYWRSSPSLGRFCGSGPLWPIISTGNRMLISYVNRNTTGHRGFFARYEALCGGEIFVEDNFTLKSPSVFGKYPPNKKCIWRIIVPEGRQVALNFQRFDLEEERNCSYDYLRILDGNSSRRFCGDKIPLDIVSTSNNLTVIFATDASVQKNGFLATVQGEWDECTIRGHECAHSCVNTIGSYRCVCDNGYQLLPDGKNCEQRCGGTLLNSRGTIRSPSSPSNDTCVWEIITSADNLIVLNFTHFDIEGENVVNSTEGWCGRARLEIFSKNGNQSVLQGLYCGSILPDALLSQENKVRIVFTSYHQVQGTGFVLDYYTVKNHCSFYNGNCHHNCINTVTNSPKCTCSNNYTLQENGLDCKKDCYHEIASTSGNITSPNYPLNYGNNDFCSWLFKTTPGHKIQVEFLNFAMESGTNCPFDYVALYDGTPSNSSLARVCGSGSNRKENSTINKLHMVFKSDHSNVFRGFQANYSTICGGTFQVSTQENHIFSHAKYGVSTYDNSSDCTWTINPLPGYNTSLTVEAFDLEFSATCTFDSVQIIEGAAVYGTFCGSKGIPGRFVSLSTKSLEEIVSAYPIAIRLRTDGSVSAEGFRIMYKAINA